MLIVKKPRISQTDFENILELRISCPLYSWRMASPFHDSSQVDENLCNKFEVLGSVQNSLSNSCCSPGYSSESWVTPEKAWQPCNSNSSLPLSWPWHEFLPGGDYGLNCVPIKFIDRNLTPDFFETCLYLDIETLNGNSLKWDHLSSH